MLTKGKSAISLKFGVAAKILCIVGVVLALLVAVAATASFQMMKIGDEIVEIAEQDIPLTEALTNITVHQLEQAINFERSLRYGEEMEHSDRAGEHFDESVHHFEELSTQVDGEIVAGTALAETAILHAGTPEAKAEFEHVHESLIAIGAAHKAFEGHALEAIELLANGEIEEAIELAESVEVEVEKLDHQLEALLTEIGTFTHHSASAAEEHEKSALSLMVIMAAISLAIGVASTLFFVRRLISKPLSEVVLALEALTKGDTSITVDVRSDDEIGAVAKAMEVFRENTIKMQEMEKEREESERRAEEEKRRAMQDLANSFEGSVKSVVQNLGSSASQMRSKAQNMAAMAEETGRQSTSVAAASEQATTNVQTVSAAAEELTSSINEISRRVADSAGIAKEAAEEANKTNESVQSLSEAAQKIGDVVELINDIAGQTNLLALNATIEAARAGEAGKGFTVVASEVKNLATQTAKATEEIAAQISSIQSATTGSVEAISSITKTIEQINELATAIASAVEEQSAATREIATNSQQAASGTQEVSSNISGVQQASNETGAAANEVLGAADELMTQSDMLGKEVENFLAGVRSA